MKKYRQFLTAFLTFYFLFTACCFAKKKMTILIHMTDAQKHFFIDEVVKTFEKENKIKVNVIASPNIDDIEKNLQIQKENVYLVKIPFINCWSLAKKNLIIPLNDFLGDYDLGFFYNDYILTQFGQKDSKQFFLPRKYETRIMVYRKSKVLEAFNSFGKYQDTLHSLLKQINGFGLPYNYSLDRDPVLWDYYDIFVLGFIWSQLTFNDTVLPRIAHRGKKYSGTALRVIDRAYQCNGDSSAVLHMEGKPIVDAFEWEAVYTYANVYNKRMWEEEWVGENIWEGFASETVFLSFMTQLDCVYLLGTGNDGINGYIDDKSDIGMTLMPTGCSVQLDGNGNVLRQGTKSISTGGWWWAIPKSCPNPKLAFRFYEFITSRSIQLEECTRFGMIPVRRDILKNEYIISDNGWISKIFRLSYKQIQKNNTTILPTHANFSSIVDVYLNALSDIVISHNWVSVTDTSATGTMVKDSSVTDTTESNSANDAVLSKDIPLNTAPEHNYISNIIIEKYAPHINKLLRN